MKPRRALMCYRLSGPVHDYHSCLAELIWKRRIMKRCLKIAVAWSRRTVLLGITAQLVASSPAAATAEPLSAADRAFLAWDIQIEIQQQDMGHIAESRAQTTDVRALGTYLGDRHRRTQQRLQQLAEQLTVTLSNDLSLTHLQIQQRYAAISEAAFDKAFVRHEVGDYRYFLSHFKAALHTRNQPIHDYCANEITRLKEDQAKIAAIMRTIDGGTRK